MGLFVQAHFIPVLQAVRCQDPNAFEDRNRASIVRDPAGAHQSRRYRQI